jgi:hypothetical protein
MERQEQIDAHVAQVAEANQVKPQEVYVFDVEKAPKITHEWKQYGQRFVCSYPGHSRHEAWGRSM